MAKLTRLWIEEISHLDRAVQESLLAEQPHTRIVGVAPREFDFLVGPDVFVDLGFENHGLGRERLHELLRAFSGSGCLVPAAMSPYWRLRNARPLHRPRRGQFFPRRQRPVDRRPRLTPHELPVAFL